MRDFIIFGLIGIIGFFVDVAVLYSLVCVIGLFYGRVISFFSAVLVTWILNRRWTFRHRSSGLESSHEFVVYFVLMVFGGAANYTAYAWLVISYQFAQQHPVVGVAVGSLSGMIINLISTRFILFKKTRHN